jgi:uncharacterized membrane protein YeaQ/YmgE (transglycosylase-associated protein family)
MGFLFMIIIGAILGWLTTIVLRIEAPRGILLNVAAGVAGALVMGLFVAPLLGSASLLGDNYSVWTLLLSLAGALLAVAMFNALWRRQAR